MPLGSRTSVSQQLHPTNSFGLTNTEKAFFHINDVHAHLDQFVKSGSDCKDPTKGCFGGYARIKTKVDELRKQSPNHLWLNAGDEFQGTLFYSFYGGEKIAETINDLKFDVMTLGNHEWDGGDKKLGEFLNNLTFPVVSANVKSQEPYFNKTVKNYHIFEKHKLAVIGATTDTTPSISSVGNRTTFLDPIAEVQKAIYEIRNTTDIRRIVALTHIGYDVDQKLAKETEGLSLIIGGHSHTLLGDMSNAEGKYPTIAKDKAGNEVFIVTSYRWGEYLGNIDVTFDKDGRALSYRGAPIQMNNETKLEEGLQTKITSWRGPFEKFAAQVIGSSKNELVQSTCQKEDCLLGEVMTDAMLAYRANLTQGTNEPKPDFAIINAGGIRAAIPSGNVTRGDVITAFPFGNAIVEMKLSGADVRKVLEGAVSRMNQFNNKKTSSWFQVSKDLQVVYDASKPEGSKLVNVTIGGKPLDVQRKEYRVVTVDFLAGGGDNIFVPVKDLATLDALDEVLVNYIKNKSPLTAELEKRVFQRGNGTSEAGKGGKDDKKDDKSGASALGASVVSLVVAVALAIIMM